jgi:hypothetical protein
MLVRPRCYPWLFRSCCLTSLSHCIVSLESAEQVCFAHHCVLRPGTVPVTIGACYDPWLVL